MGDYPVSADICYNGKMQIKCLKVGELETNCYLIWDEETQEALIIDPADEANFVTEEVLGLKIQPTAIVLTHGHFDHCLAANELQMAFLIPVYLHPKDLFLINRLSETAEHFLKRKISEKIPADIKFIDYDSLLQTGRNYLKILQTPGHTPGSICLYSSEENCLFSGDTLFAHGTIGRTDFSYGSEKDLKDSLEKLSSLPKETILYPGHGHTGMKIAI